ncbi:MAG: DUF2935 domain-containing protein [Candidatus Rokuibacteriota bacterium]
MQARDSGSCVAVLARRRQLKRRPSIPALVNSPPRDYSATKGGETAEASRGTHAEDLPHHQAQLEGGATDPVSFSLADTLFWTDIEMEHAQFFVTLMPGDELAQHRAEAKRFKTTFAAVRARANCEH